MSVLSFQAVGLILCMVGAAILMRAFAFATFADLAEPARLRKDAAKSVVGTLCAQRIDSRFGAPLLILGFGSQLLSTLHVGEKPLVMFLVLAAIGVAVMYYSLMRDLIATTATDAIFMERETMRETPIMIEAKREAPLTPRVNIPAFEVGAA